MELWDGWENHGGGGNMLYRLANVDLLLVYAFDLASGR